MADAPEFCLRALQSVSWVTYFLRELLVTQPSNDPLHGLSLASILTALVEQHGWDGLAQRIDIRCFKSEPSIKSSLTFLRKTPWARSKVEELYLRGLRNQ